LRNYLAGDALPRIAWKTLARGQGLQKQFSAQQGQELWLDWAQLPAVSDEHKLSILTRWVLDAELKGVVYGLRLPDNAAGNVSRVPLGQGQSHQAECLKALALFGIAS
jgi:uncharacterized protein (DUF58 family)